MRKIKFSENVEFLLSRANDLGILVEIIGRDMPILMAKYGENMVAMYNGRLPLNSSGSAKISKDKTLTKLVLSHSGINVPKGFLVKKIKEVETDIKKQGLRYPLVVKPNDEALGNGVIADIPDIKGLVLAVNKLSENYNEILIEEYFVGDDYRFLVLDGEVIAVAKRLRPGVIGNGKETITKLVNVYNHGRIHKVSFDDEVKRYLSKQGYTLDSVLGNGVSVILRGNSNYRTGGYAVDVTDLVAKEYKDLAAKAATFIGLRLAGVDILIKNNSVFGDYTVTEVNSVPGFDVHVCPDEGRGRKEILDKVWAKILNFKLNESG